jgi:hypothetical protein
VDLGGGARTRLLVELWLPEIFQNAGGDSGAGAGAFLWLDHELVNPPSTVPAAPLRGSVQGTERNA